MGRRFSLYAGTARPRFLRPRISSHLAPAQYVGVILSRTHQHAGEPRSGPPPCRRTTTGVDRFSKMRPTDAAPAIVGASITTLGKGTKQEGPEVVNLIFVRSLNVRALRKQSLQTPPLLELDVYQFVICRTARGGSESPTEAPTGHPRALPGSNRPIFHHTEGRSNCFSIWREHVVGAGHKL